MKRQILFHLFFVIFFTLNGIWSISSTTQTTIPKPIDIILNFVGAALFWNYLLDDISEKKK